MKKKKNILYSFVLYGGVIVVGACIVILICMLRVANNKNKALQKEVNKYNAITAPYYEKDAFVKPLEKKGVHAVSQKIPIIMYHYVSFAPDKNDLVRKRLEIAPRVFEEHLKQLQKNHYETYFVKDIPDILSSEVDYSTKSAVLTFDDGYEDFYSIVFPLLKKYHMRGTVYIIYNYIGRKGFLNEQNIKELLESDLVEIGSHTLDHVYLKQVPEIFARKQIVESKQKFEEQFGIKIKTFAYPYGAFNDASIQMVKESGYTAAVSVIPGTMQSADNLYYLSRLRPGLFFPSYIVSFIEEYNK